MPLPYDFNAARMRRANLDPQLNNGGMIEFHINGLVPGGKEVLMIGLKSMSFPRGRKIGKNTIHYLNGVVKVPGKVDEPGDITCVFQDYINGRQRLVLHSWFDYVFDERTGRGVLPSRLKTAAHAVLFGADGETRAQYYIEGVWPQQDPNIPPIDFSSAGLVDISVPFSVDAIYEDVVSF